MVACVVVTFNRLALLKSCIAALHRQTRLPDAIYIVDNASTDGTGDWIASELPRSERIRYVRLERNTGGAGGFAAGLSRACDEGHGWIWIMDDDAEPRPSALEELVSRARDAGNVYGSLAAAGSSTCWATVLLADGERVVHTIDEVPSLGEVQSLPFLGFMIHRNLIERIGLPDEDLFIAADDIEYCVRARFAGARLFIVGSSLIDHPKSDRYEFRVPGKSLICLRLAPWKRYYDTRNRLLIARRYYGARLLTQTVPGSLVRFIAALRNEDDRLQQSWAFFGGMVDGLLGRAGMRHERWRIKR